MSYIVYDEKAVALPVRDALGWMGGKDIRPAGRFTPFKTREEADFYAYAPEYRVMHVDDIPDDVAMFIMQETIR